mmetsp:Transcript_40443/g.41256  ORF Transcript_40443/g.41256 Transcript_40443/m.41256 type:complete len:177 (-) Transcript_40443:180-710(-)
MFASFAILLCLGFILVANSFRLGRKYHDFTSPIRLTQGASETIPKKTFDRKAVVAFNSNNSDNDNKDKGSNPFDAIASAGLAGVLAIAVAEAFFWAAGVPIANLYFKITEGEWLDLATQEGQIRAAGFSFGYGTFATAVLQYRVTIAAIPLIPIMEKYVVTPGKKYFGEKFGEKST